MTVISLILAVALSVTLFSGCGAAVNSAETTSTENFAGQRLGLVTGTVYEDIAREHYPEAGLYFYNSCADLAEALDKGKIDAYMLDEPVGRLLTQTYPDQCVSPVIEPVSYAYAFAKDSERSDRLREQMDAFIKECRQNGVLRELNELWLSTDEERKTIDLSGLTGENGTLRFAVSTDAGDPFIYYKEDRLVGYEVDLMARFCAKYGYALEMNNYSFASLLFAVISGKEDIAACTLAITDERKELVDFSLPTYDSGVVVMTKTVSAENKRLGIVTGTMFEDVAKEHFPEAELYFYNTCADLAEALDKGKIDVYMLDEPVGRLLTQSYPDQRISAVIEPASYAYAFAKGSERSDRLREQMDAFIEECRQNGVIQELDDLWLGTDEARKTVDLSGLTGENGTLRFAVSTDAGDPFIYYKEDKLVGYEIDLMARFCTKYGYTLEMSNYSFASLLLAVSGGKEDIAACTIAITEERKESMNFSLPTYVGGVVTVTKTASAEDPSKDFAGKKLGVVTGTVYEDVARRNYPDAELLFYNNCTDLAEALNTGKIDGYVLDEPVGRLVVLPYADQQVSSVIEPASYAFAFAKGSERSDRLRGQFDAFVEECRQNGVLQEIDDVWFGTDESRKTVSLEGLTGENGTVRLATSTDIGAPFVYFKDGALVGYEIDLLARFCREYGYALEMTDYSFPSLLAAVISGKDDVAACTLAITEERKESVNFSVPTYEGGVVTVTRSDASENTPGGTVQKKVGVVVGTMYEDVARRLYPNEEICFYNNTADLAKALDKGEIDFYMVDEPVGRLVVKPYPDQRVSEIIEPASFAFAFPKDSEFGSVLREQLNAFIEECRQNGVLQEIEDIWFGDDESKKSVSFDRLTGENGMIRLAISSDIGDPFVYFKNGGLVGYEPDLLVRFCLEYGYDLEITSYTFSALFPALSEGMNDIAACAITVTPEREEIVDFSLPTYDSGVVIVDKEQAVVYTLKDFSGKKIGVITGSVFDSLLKKYIPDAVPEYVNTYADLAAAVASGKIDAYVADEPVAHLMRQGQYPDQVIALQLEEASYAFMFPKGSEKHQELCRQFNEFLAQSRADGTIAEIGAVWFGNDETRQDVDLSGLTAENGVLEMAVSSDVGAPFVYVKNGHMVGYDVDVAARFCRAYGYGLHITDYAFSGIPSAVSGGKADMAAASIAITPERLETALMSDPDYLGGIVIVTRRSESGEESATFWTSLRKSFERTFLREDRWKLFISGLGITFMITMVSMILGTLGGFVIYLVIRRGSRIFNGIWALFASVMGRTPVVVILMILYYIIFGNSDLSNVWVSIIGFTALFTCTVAELLKMGAGAVDGGQAEAALAMGYSEHETYLHVIFPQSIEHFLPAYKSEVITLVKATAIVGYIAVQDLTKVSDLIRSRTYEAFFPLIATAIIYYALTFVLTGLIRRINVATDPRRRSKKRILRGVKTK